MEEKVLLFAGTSEGRRLYDFFLTNGIPFDISVATEYGRELLEEKGKEDSHILVNRLSEAEMEALLRTGTYSLVVDATHPYAAEVTKNIHTACQAAQVEYLRLLREEGRQEGVIRRGNLAGAVDYLRSHEGNILSTIGSKELRQLTALEHFEERVFARILPLPEAVAQCHEMGFQGKNLICMQGPFSFDMNVAMLRQYQCRYLLTKNSGKAGGFDEKLSAAKAAGAKVLLVDRPSEEQGMAYEEITSLLKKRFGVIEKETSKGERWERFPLFVDTKEKKVLVVGGGAVASRRISSLLHFQWEVTVIAPRMEEKLVRMAESGRICWEQRKVCPQDIHKEFSLIVAATDSREVNREVGRLAREENIWVSVADRREECTFYFPALAFGSHTVAGIVGNGESHGETARMAAKIREVLE